MDRPATVPRTQPLADRVARSAAGPDTVPARPVDLVQE
jgi:hypothetical protein